MCRGVVFVGTDVSEERVTKNTLTETVAEAFFHVRHVV
jgi:hypothetical protein